jgi:signal transduction histidine kinase
MSETMTSPAETLERSPAVAAASHAEALTDRERELGAIILAYNEVTEKLKVSYERLESEVSRLREELAAKNRELERRKRLAALGEMAAGLAHEIRNPLGGISLFASLLEQDCRGSETALDLVHKIQKGVGRLDGVVSNVLAFAHPRQLERRRALLKSILTEAVEMARPHCVQRCVEIVIDDAVGDQEFLADAGQLQRAVLNLLLNASEASEAGGLVRLSSRRAGADHVEIEVADRGGGIDGEALDRLFNPFFTTKETGTGLGLAIVHRIVESHGGTVRASNRPGGGAAFTIRLPLLNELRAVDLEG